MKAKMIWVSGGSTESQKNIPVLHFLFLLIYLCFCLSQLEPPFLKSCIRPSTYVPAFLPILTANVVAVDARVSRAIHAR